MLNYISTTEPLLYIFMCRQFDLRKFSECLSLQIAFAVHPVALPAAHFLLLLPAQKLLEPRN